MGRAKWIFVAPLLMLGFLVFLVLGGAVVQWLWNWLAPSLFGWSQITLWQGLGLLVLCRILFGGWGFGNRGRSRSRHGGTGRVVDRMARRWERMSPEERTRFRDRIRERFDACEPSSPSSPSSGQPA